MSNVHAWFANTTAQAAAGWVTQFFQETNVQPAALLSNKVCDHQRVTYDFWLNTHHLAQNVYRWDWMADSESTIFRLSKSWVWCGLNYYRRPKMPEMPTTARQMHLLLTSKFSLIHSSVKPILLEFLISFLRFVNELFVITWIYIYATCLFSTLMKSGKTKSMEASRDTGVSSTRSMSSR